MTFLYNILIYIVIFFLHIVAIINKKIRLFINGRKETFHKLKTIDKDDKVIWIHAASLGEFEQGRPIIEQIKQQYPTYKILLTFFSPSGYEIRKNYDLADIVCYLPLDTKRNMRRFIKQTHPNLAIIIKYEFWPNLLRELSKTNINTILVSGIFRDNQLFFKSYGHWIRKPLLAFKHFFVQNKQSEELLHSINLKNTTISGDTRFDRVYKILQQDNTLDFIADFKNNTYTIVAGSSWKEDEALLTNYINHSASLEEKFIIAPHNINSKNIEELQKSIKKNVILYSHYLTHKESIKLSDYTVLIIDCIGLLTKIYSYADVAYVGGGLQTGLHNILEPATFGIPIVFGAHKYQKFQEAVDLVEKKGCETVTNQKDFSTIFTVLKTDINLRTQMGTINKEYVEKNVGATHLIMNYITKNL